MKSIWVKFLALATAGLIVLIILYFLLNSTNPPIANSVPPIPLPSLAKINTKENFERNNKLQSATDGLLPLFDKMKRVPIFLTDEIINKEGNNTEKGVAYTTCEKDRQPNIFVKKVFFEQANRKQLQNILKHELTHAWQCRQGMMWGHDERFRKKFTEVGGFGN